MPNFLDLGYSELLEYGEQLTGSTAEATTALGSVSTNLLGNPTVDSVSPNQILSGSLTKPIVMEKKTWLVGGADGFVDGAGFYLGWDSTLAKYVFFAGDSAGQYISWNGTILSIIGSISATTGSIGGFDIGSDYIRDAGNSFGLASTVTAGDDVRFWAGAAYASRATAPFRITEAGALTATSATITGAITTSAGSSLDGSYLTAGSVASASANLALRGWTQTCVFSVTDADTVAWGAGTFTASDGTSYSIGASNTGNMAAKTYIYLDIAVSTTAYQVTTTATTAVGNGKVLVAIAQNGTGEATFMLLNNNSYNIDAANIVAGSITANEIAASTITANKMSVSQLSAIAADLGAITAGTIVLPSGGYIRSGQTAYDTGTGFYLGNDSGTPKFSIGNSAGDKLTWNGTALSITGSLTATTGTIGGFTIGATTITATNLSLDSAGQRITLGTTNDVVILDADDATYRLWAGNATAASAPFSVSKAGALVATSATITGSITSTSGTIGGFTIGATTITATNLTLDSANQRISLGSTNDIIIMDADDATYRLWIGNATAASAPFSVSKAGALVASSATVTGAITTSAGSSINGTYLTSNSVASASVNLAMRGWTQTSVFSVTDADTVSWGSGTFTASDGTAYSISAGNTGNMAAKTYIYLDTGVSTTEYQTTTTASTAVGNSKVLIATAQNGTTEPTFMLMNDNSYNIDAANIVAGSITANEIAAATITATKMSVSQLSAIAADLGAITAGTIVLPSGGFMRSGQTAYDTGTGFYIGNDSGTPKFSLGNSSGNKLTWDGTTLSITGSISVSSIPNLPGDENLWARWGMDEGSGTSIIDLSGNSRTGTSVGTTYATGKAGQALSFNSTDYVTLPSTGMPTSALTVSVWVKADSHASSRRIIWNNWSVAGDWIIYSDATNWIFGIKSAGPTDQLITYAHSSDTASWHHLVGTYDGTTQRFYVDGTEVGTALTHTTTLSTGGTFRLSHDAFDTFAGSIDEVRIYSTAVTATNVKGLYSNPSAVSTSGIITAKSGLIGGFTIGASSITAVSGGNTTTVSSGSTAFSAGPTGSPTFTVTQAGALTSTSGAIGGFDIGTDYIRDAGNSFGLASTVTGGDDTRFWAGATYTNRATAPFRVTESGIVTASSIVLSGVTFNGSDLTDSVEIIRGYNLTPNFNVDSQNGASFAVPSGFSDATTNLMTFSAAATGTSDDYNCLSFAISGDIGAAFYLQSDSGRASAGAGTSTTAGAIYIGSDYWWNDDGNAEIDKNNSAVTVSGTTRYGPMGHDPTNSYLLVLYSTTKIARYSGISGTTITAQTDITLDTAVTSTVGFLFDNTNSRYICVDTTNNLIRRFNSSGTTIDTASYTITDTNIKGLAILSGRVHIVLMKTVDVDTRSTNSFVDLVPTSMII